MFELFSMVVALTIHFTTLTLSADAITYNPASDDGVVEAKFHFKGGWYANELDGCAYSGIRSYYTRDWEEVSGNPGHETRLAPEPDKIAGVVSVINKKECPGKPTEGVLVIDATRVSPFGDIKKGGIAPGLRLKYLDITTATEEQKPKWLPQVLAKVEVQATKGNPEAQRFMEAQTLLALKSPVEVPLSSAD